MEVSINFIAIPGTNEYLGVSRDILFSEVIVH